MSVTVPDLRFYSVSNCDEHKRPQSLLKCLGLDSKIVLIGGALVAFVVWNIVTASPEQRYRPDQRFCGMAQQAIVMARQAIVKENQFVQDGDSRLGVAAKVFDHPDKKTVSNDDKKAMGKVVKEYLNNTPTCFLVVFAEWCPHCKQAAPKIADISKKYPHIPLMFCNFEAIDTETAHGLKVQYFPQLMKKDNNRVETIPLSQLETSMEQLSTASAPAPSPKDDKVLPADDKVLPAVTAMRTTMYNLV